MNLPGKWICVCIRGSTFPTSSQCQREELSACGWRGRVAEGEGGGSIEQMIEFDFIMIS